MAKQWFSTAGVAMRQEREEGKPLELRVWNGTVYAESEEMARVLTLGATLEEWPMKEGYVKHEVFIRPVPLCCEHACTHG